MLTEYSYWLWEKVLSDEWCDQVIKHIDSQDLHEGGVGQTNEKPDEKIRKSFVTFTDDKNIMSVAKDFIFKANKNAKWNFDIDAFEHVQLSKYGESNHYSWHRDNFLKPDENTELGYDLFRKVRKLSLVINLSDENSYEGGDFLFDFRDNNDGSPNTLKLENFKKKGSVLVFPSFIYHTVQPVTKGVRYSMVNWSRGWPWK